MRNDLKLPLKANKTKDQISQLIASVCHTKETSSRINTACFTTQLSFLHFWTDSTGTKHKKTFGMTVNHQREFRVAAVWNYMARDTVPKLETLPKGWHLGSKPDR